MEKQSEMLFSGIESRGPPRLTLYTKKPCPLCDELKEQLTSFQHRFQLEEVDITAPGNERFRKMYRYEIPVLYLDGRFLCKHRVDVQYFEQRLIEAEEERKSQF